MTQPTSTRHSRSVSIRLARRLATGLALAAGLLLGGPLAAAEPATQEVETVVLAPVRIGTAAQSRCGGRVLDTPGVECQGFDAREVRELPDLWVVGYENNADLDEKHVLQTVAAFDLGPLRGLPENATLSSAALTYSEASTVRRSPDGESEYGVLPTCNTGLGVPTGTWNGSLDRLVQTRPAATAGVTGATTGDAGSWDVTPQLQQWLAGPGNQGVLVLRGDDESLDVRGLGMCLSYVIDLTLTVEYTIAP